jgi:ferrochelatase
MTILNGIQELVDLGVKKILLFPLYPQFAMATTETISVLVKEICSEKFPDLIIEEIPPFYNNPDYIEVLSESIKNNIDLHQIDHLLFSYHGIPERHIRKSDITKSHCKVDGTCCDTPSPAHQFCYSHQCKEVTKLVAEKLKLKNYSTSFQSRLGFDPWLQPYTDRTIERLGKSGTKRMAIVTPAFVSDCLETLEEIAMEGKEIFEEVGGDEFTTIPCLNDNDDWVDLISNWVDNWKDNGKCF